LVAFLAATFVLPLSAANEPAPVQPALDKSKARDLLRSLAFFERNQGQVADRVLFLTQGLGYPAYLTRDGATLVFSESSKAADGRTTSSEKVIRLNLVGIDPHPEVIGSEERPGITSYFSGADPSPHTVFLSGAGGTPLATLSATNLTFASQGLNTPSAPQRISVTNTGSAEIHFTSVAATGDFSQTNTCVGSPLMIGQICAISAVFTPTAIGSRTGTLSIVDNTSNSAQTVALVGTGGDFSLSAASTSATVTAGQPATYNLQLSPTGFSGTIALTCTGAPSTVTCTPTPATLTTNGTSPVSFAANVTTQAHSALFRQAPESFRRPPISPMVPAISLVAIAWFIFLALLLGGTQLSRHSAHVRVKSACFLAIASAAIFLAACGGGSTTTPPNVGTQKGTYTLVLTAKSGSLTHTMNLTLNVN
jgi:hypothetical protein